jgi:type VI secretion system Hcp family effector
MGIRRLFEARIAAPVLILTAWGMLAETGCAQAQASVSSGTGYMLAISASGHVIAGESTDPAYNGWIPLRQTTMPTTAQMAAMAQEDAAQGLSGSAAASTAKAVHPPIVVVKDRDRSSLVLLGACSSHQHFPEIDITVTDYSDRPAKRYKLSDATIISIRASVMADGSLQSVEQLRINYAKIEVQK